MVIPLDAISVATFGKTVCCEYAGCGFPAMGVRTPLRIFLCEDHAKIMGGTFHKFAKDQSLAQVLRCTEIEIEVSASDRKETSVQGESKTSP
jgi:hypothetical protein